MKWIGTLSVGALLAATALPSLAQDKKAEKLFREMEERLLAAKAFELTFAYQFDQWKTEGELLLTQDNKMRLKLRGHFDNKPDAAAFEVICDGKLFKTNGGKPNFDNRFPYIERGGHSQWTAPKKLHGPMTKILSRGGIWLTVYWLPYLLLGDLAGGEVDPDGKDPRFQLQAYDFTLAGTEKLGEHDAWCSTIESAWASPANRKRPSGSTPSRSCPSSDRTLSNTKGIVIASRKAITDSNWNPRSRARFSRSRNRLDNVQCRKREEVCMTEPLTIRCRENGPLLVPTTVRIVDHQGNVFALPQGKEMVALCRCGQSKNKPFCDGSHKTCGFLAAELAPPPVVTPPAATGG
jgi:CDGSH-type Zn-finger protein